jgi:SAM-dependent methyltransferase
VDAGAVARCDAGHSFDFASSGYLNLLVGRGSRRAGDTAEMARARAAFLGAGHYEPIASAVADEALASSPAKLVEVGAGTGHHLGRAARRVPGSIAVGIDLSKHAAAIGAREVPGAGFVVADAEERIPVGDAAAEVALSVFAPRPAAELKRILAPAGRLVVCFANPEHLASLRESMGLMAVEPAKLRTLRERLAPELVLESASEVRFAMDLHPRDAEALVAMGPNARHDGDRPPPRGAVETAASVTIASFRRR